MQVTDFLLSDRRQWVDGIVPCVQSLVLGELREAGILELCLIFDPIDFLDELGPLGKHIYMVRAEVVDVVIEVSGNLAIALVVESCIS